MTWKLKLLFEWGGGALGADDDATRDTALDWDYPPDPSPWPPEEFAKFEAAALEVLDWIRRELGDDYEVRYQPL